MTVPSVAGQFYPTREDLVNVYLRAIAGWAGRRGIVVNVLPGSEYEMRAQAAANVALAAFANNKLGLAAVSPLDATGEQLIELAEVFGIEQRPASKASGLVAVRLNPGFTTATIPSGYQGTCEDGTKIVTTGINTITGNTTIAVETVEAGEDLNQAALTKCTWDSASVGGLRRSFNVFLGGLTGGHDADTEEVVRDRLLERIANPGAGGNWAHIATLSTNSSAAIQRTYVYPSIQGPGTVGIALIAEGGDRTVSDVIVTNAAAAVIAELSGRCKLNATTVTPEQVDVVIALDLPTPQAAGNRGGGWLDASPWPNATVPHAKITSYNSTTGTITTNAAASTGLSVGSHIAIWDYADEVMREFVVINFTVGPNVQITVSGGFPKDFTGHYVSAGAVNIADYATTALAAFATLGPGEKSSSVAVLPRARRQPTVDVAGQMALNTRLLSTIQQTHPEIDSIEWSARYVTGTTTNKTTPTIPGASTGAPYVLTLKHLAFRAL